MNNNIYKSINPPRNMEINRFKHLLEEYLIIEELIQNQGPTKENSRRLLILTAAVGFQSLMLKDSITDEEKETVVKLLVVNKMAMKVSEDRMFNEYNKEIKKEQNKLKNKNNKFLDLYLDLKEIDKREEGEGITVETAKQTLDSLKVFGNILLSRLKQFPKSECTEEETRVVEDIKIMLTKIKNRHEKRLNSKN